MAMEQDPYMNHYGTWRVFERYWIELMKDGEVAGEYIVNFLAPLRLNDF